MSAPEKDGAQGAVDDEALIWALRMTEPEADWEAFTAWLEADPRRSTRYDKSVLALDAAADTVVHHRAARAVEASEQKMFAEARPSRAVGRRGWLGGALAAAVLGTIGVGFLRDRDETYMVATAAGEQRTIRLADGSSIILAGGSRIRLDKARPRSAILDTGQALFQVRHDERHPFQVNLQGLALTDLGTVFDVRVLGASTQVAVAEGAVMVESPTAKLRLDPGQSVVSADGQLQRGTQDAATIGSWRGGRLTYDNATISEVAEDLTRQLGVPIKAAPAVAERHFNGTLEIQAFREKPAVLGSLLGVRVTRDARGWTLDVAR